MDPEHIECSYFHKTGSGVTSEDAHPTPTLVPNFSTGKRHKMGNRFSALFKKDGSFTPWVGERMGLIKGSEPGKPGPNK